MRKYVISAARLTEGNILYFTIAPKRDKDAIDFKPGQYASISYKINGRPSPMRCFSITGQDSRTNSLSFAVRVEGNFTQALANLPIGSAIRLRGPFGSFVIDEHYDQNIVMIAGGIGITPFMSMVRASTKYSLPNRLILLYSSSSQSSVPFVNEIARHEQLNQRFNYALFVTQGDVGELAGKRVIRGRIKDTHLEQLTAGDYNRCTYFICGPRAFIGSYASLLRKHGVSSDRIVTEEFALANSLTSLVMPKDRASRLAYAITAASLVIGTGFMASLDLVRYMPRYASAQAVLTSKAASAASSPTTNPSEVAQPTPAAASTMTAQAPATTSSPSTTTAPTASNNIPPAPPTSPAPTAPTATTPSQATAPQPVTYQAPVTTVS